MLSLNQINESGEHPFFFSGAEGLLEALFTVPVHPRQDVLAILGHPHSLQGGTMNNKVVTTLARTFRALNISSVRFNFRGVGASEGTYDAGIGEAADMIALYQACRQLYPYQKIIFAGFSFGSYVAYRAMHYCQGDLLITIAPPVHHYNYEEFLPEPWLIIQGEADEVVPAELVYQFAEKKKLALPILRFAQTGHFFHGKLLNLKEELTEFLSTRVNRHESD